MTVRAPIDVRPVTCTCDSSRHPGPITTSGPTTQNGPISASSATVAAGSTEAREWMRAIVGLGVGDHGADLGLAYELTVHLGLAAEPPHGLAPRDLGHVELDAVARHDRAAELRLVDGEEVDVLRRVLLLLRDGADHARR